MQLSEECDPLKLNVEKNVSQFIQQTNPKRVKRLKNPLKQIKLSTLTAYLHALALLLPLQCAAPLRLSGKSQEIKPQVRHSTKCQMSIRG